MTNRRARGRMPVDIFFNKFLDGYPYLCRGINLSGGGLLALTYSEPKVTTESFSLELRLPGDARSIWLWARGVWRRDECQALQFVNVDAGARARISRYLAQSSALA